MTARIATRIACRNREEETVDQSLFVVAVISIIRSVLGKQRYWPAAIGSLVQYLRQCSGVMRVFRTRRSDGSQSGIGPQLAPVFIQLSIIISTYTGNNTGFIS